ncbi:MAG: hypothetical protein EKK63_12635 [Acinetobacter sp.]|uniref:hypothetical protein n=1 Tax=Acinetobacter sp. TaxID=472 RepID=UPI000FBB5499|nr:hypothetical protein [Acinetobacter sp.]RUP38220.1 MAG: hypothetical protein EKK63_12635 [Acinetobacter sp.]
MKKKFAHRKTDLEHFIKRFEPVFDADTQETLKQFCWTNKSDMAEIEKAKQSNTLWTMLDCEGKMYLSAGYHLVNRMFYVICKKPHVGVLQRDYFYS